MTNEKNLADIEVILGALEEPYIPDYISEISEVKNLMLHFLEKTRVSLRNRDYIDARKHLKSYVQMEEIFIHEDIGYSEKLHKEYLKLNSIRKDMKKINGFYDDSKSSSEKDRAYE